MKEMNEKVEQSELSGEQIENNSFTPYMKRKVKKLRKKALQYGIDVPYLKYELDKPQKTRTIFNIIAIIFFVLAGLVAVGTIFMYIYTNIFSAIVEISNTTGSFTSYETLEKTFGLSGFAGIVNWSLIIVLIVITIVPIPIIIGTIKFAMENLNFAKMSRQEMAKGTEIKRYNIFLAITIVCSLIVGVYFIVNGIKGSFGIAIIVLLFALALLCLALLIIIMMERKKEQQWFSSLTQEKQEDFLEFEKSLQKIKMKKKEIERF